jgi:hypothetical protein
VLADQEYRTVNVVDIARDVLGVEGQSTEWVRGRQHRYVVCFQIADVGA